MIKLPAPDNVRVLPAIIGLALLLAFPPTLLAAPPGACQIGARSAALLQLALSRQGKSQMLPHDCTTLAHERVCLPPVSVDGHRLSDLSLLSGDVTEAEITHTRLQSTQAIRVGIAVAVFDYLLDLAARHDRIRVTTAEARALAQRELKMYQSSPHACGAAPPIPPGMSPRQYFLSPHTIEAYRQGIIIGRERERILRRYPGLAPGPAIRRWLQAQVREHAILIDGKKPTFSIADTYPGA